MTNATTYAHHASAAKAAKRQGLDKNDYTINPTDDGRFEIVPVVTLAKLRKNGQGPVAQVWAFLAANCEMDRKEQIKKLIGSGYNPNMVRTQTSRYYTTGGDKAAWLAREKAMRDEEKRALGLA